MQAFPIFMQANGRTIIVFGGGADAAAKLRLVAKTEARVLVVAPDLSAGEIDLGDAQWVRCDPLSFEFPENVAFAYAATGDAKLDAKIADHARAHKVLICAADQPEVSDFITPAIVDRDPVVVAIGTEGTAPVLARMIKAQVEAALPQHLGRLAHLASQFRERVAARFAPGGTRRSFWRKVFGGALSGQLKERDIHRRAEALLRGNGHRHAEAGRVSFVGAGPGGPDLMTLRARAVLDEADVVLYDALASKDILELARREALLIPVGKRCGQHAFTQADICKLIVEHALEGHHVVRLKGGDPSIFGRLAEELDAVNQAGLAFDIVPGVTAAAAASASAAAPLTERGQGQELRVVTAHSAHGEADVDWSALASGHAAVAVYMGKRVARTVQRQMILNGRDPATPVVLVENAGRRDEVIHHGTLSSLAFLAEQTSKGAPLMMLIGVASRRLSSAQPLAAPVFPSSRKAA